MAEHGDVRELTGDVEVAVVATGSAMCCQVVTALPETVRVEQPLLEEFLFPRRSEYQQVAELLRTAGTSGWVNTPRLLWPGYQELRAALDEAPLSLRVQGNPAHGLGSNAVHFVDLFRFIVGDDAAGPRGAGLHGWNLRVEIVDAVRLAVAKGRAPQESLYGSGQAAARIVEVLRDVGGASTILHKSAYEVEWSEES